MKNQIDFFKINGGIWGAINFNNMIPVHSSCLQRIDMKIYPTDSSDVVEYKNLLMNQHDTIVGGKARPELMARCCNFLVDEKQYQIYCETHNLCVENSEPAAIESKDLSSVILPIADQIAAAQAKSDRRNDSYTSNQQLRPKPSHNTPSK